MDQEFERLSSWLNRAKDDLDRQDGSEYLSKLMILDAEIKTMLRRRMVFGGKPRRKRFVFSLAAVSLAAIILFIAVAVQLSNLVERTDTLPTTVAALTAPATPVVASPAKPEASSIQLKPSPAKTAQPKAHARAAHSRRVPKAAASATPSVASQPPAPKEAAEVKPAAPKAPRVAASKLNALELLAKMEDDFSRKKK